jgi:hypothetical protein
MKKNIDSMEVWEFGAIGIANPSQSTLKRYFELINLTQGVNGDIAEFGVSKGNSIITSALVLRKMNIDKKVYGFDTFAGFPGYAQNDNFEVFADLHKSGGISEDHYRKVLLNQEYILSRGAKTSPDSISNSADFANTSLNLVQNKIKLFNLENQIRLVKGDFTENLSAKISELTFSLILIDSDLYDSYAKTLPVLWEKLSPGGYIYLDEYYSLKFPGPRIAVDDFVNQTDCNLIRLEDWLDFERWAIHKK